MTNKDLALEVHPWAHKIGKYWEHIPDCEERATCQHCVVTKTLEHIMLECTHPGQDQQVDQIVELRIAHYQKPVEDPRCPALF
jgi:hypothetical protein